MFNTWVDNILFLIVLITFIIWFFNQLINLVSLKPSLFFTWKRFKYPTLLLFIFGIPIVFVKLTSFNLTRESISDNTYKLYSWIVAFLVSMIWMRYIIKLDIYDKEKWKHIFFVFVMSFITTYGCHILYPLFHAFGFSLNGNIVNDFIYCIFGIGLIEETVKLIPFLILLKFTKAINEPYDYLLYASISALGFAFAENAMYLNNYGIHIVAARAFYAAVAHMTFCSTIAYGLLLKKYRFTKYPTFLVFLAFFFIAIFTHGFYDFWLINESVSSYAGITTIFFLISVHLWFIMKNNAINTSPFYAQQIKLDNDSLKQHLVLSLCGIFMFSYIYVAIFYGKIESTRFFWSNFSSYGYIIFYLILSFSNYRIIKGKINPFKITFNIIVPSLKK